MVGWWWVNHSPQTDTTSSTNAQGRSAYAQLYDAFWRSDDRTSATLITATLFPPSLTFAVQAAEEKTLTEQQIADRVKTLAPADVAVFLTIDSITGSFTDEEINKGLRFTADDRLATLMSWEPIVANSRVVNAPSGTSSQQGIAIFRFASPLEWNSVKSLKLTVSGLPKTSPRDFVWSGGILAQVLP
jgi:hypothetical protein